MPYSQVYSGWDPGTGAAAQTAFAGVKRFQAVHCKWWSTLLADMQSAVPALGMQSVAHDLQAPSATAPAPDQSPVTVAAPSRQVLMGGWDGGCHGGAPFHVGHTPGMESVPMSLGHPMTPVSG